MNKKEIQIWDELLLENELVGKEFIEDFRRELQKIKKELNVPEKPKILRLENVFSPEEEDPYEFLEAVFFLQKFYEKAQELKEIFATIRKKTEKILISDDEEKCNEEKCSVNYYDSYENLVEKAEMLFNEIDMMKKSEFLRHPFAQAYFSDKVSLNELKYFIKLSKNFNVGTIKINDRVIPAQGLRNLISKVLLQKDEKTNGKIIFYLVKNTLTPFQYTLLLILREISFNEDKNPVVVVEELFELFLLFLIKCYKILEHTETRASIMVFLMRLFFANEMDQPEEIIETRQKRLAWLRYKRKQLTESSQDMDIESNESYLEEKTDLK